MSKKIEPIEITDRKGATRRLKSMEIDATGKEWIGLTFEDSSGNFAVLRLKGDPRSTVCKIAWSEPDAPNSLKWDGEPVYWDGWQ